MDLITLLLVIVATAVIVIAVPKLFRKSTNSTDTIIDSGRTYIADSVHRNIVSNRVDFVDSVVTADRTLDDVVKLSEDVSKLFATIK